MDTTLDRKALLALVDASQTITRERDLDEVFNRIAEHAAEVLNAEGASVLLLNDDRRELIFQAAAGFGAGALVGERFDARRGIAGQTAKSGRAVRIDQVRRNRHFFPGIDAKMRTRTRGLMAAPLIHVERVLGVVEVVNARGRERFTDADLELLKVFTNIAAAAAANAQAYDRLARTNRGLREARPAERMIGRSDALTRLLKLCRKVARTDATVLLSGETGTGKELAAQLIHRHSRRAEQPLIAIHCAALPESLLESELFGHEKGAFTGASERKPGRFELADRGTLFLDEIGELSPAVQVKLLRVIQERAFVRVGGTRTTTCDVRLIAATNRDLRREIDAGRFREDLYYRLNVFPVALPPLRQRPTDLPLLAEHFARRVAPSLGIEPATIHPSAMERLRGYAWPGNVRELRNVIERAALLAEGQCITPDCLPPEITQPATRTAEHDRAHEPPAGISRLAEQERATILQALTESGWNQSAAARGLGVSRDHLRYRIKKYGLKRRAASG